MNSLELAIVDAVIGQLRHRPRIQHALERLEMDDPEHWKELREACAKHVALILAEARGIVVDDPDSYRAEPPPWSDSEPAQRPGSVTAPSHNMPQAGEFKPLGEMRGEAWREELDHEEMPDGAHDPDSNISRR